MINGHHVRSAMMPLPYLMDAILGFRLVHGEVELIGVAKGCLSTEIGDLRFLLMVVASAEHIILLLLQQALLHG